VDSAGKCGYLQASSSLRPVKFQVANLWRGLGPV
jgi:hypothetical protein